MFSTEATRATAQKVLDYINEYPEAHSQYDFFGNAVEAGCGTAMCIAGTAAFVENDYSVSKARAAENRHGLSIESYAGNLLGLDSGSEINAIFYEMSDERAVQKLKKIVVGEEFSEEDYWTVDDGSNQDRLYNVLTGDVKHVDTP